MVRGPMSVMYGNNAFTGVVNIVTNDVARMGSLVGLSAGSRSSGRLSARYKDLTVNLRYQKMDYGIYLTTPSVGDPNHIDLETMHGDLTYETALSERTSLHVLGIFSKETYYLSPFSIVGPTWGGTTTWKAGGRSSRST